MTASVLMYHDVTAEGCEETSGFPGGDAGRYKLTPQQFERHLDAIAARVSAPILTFDDGGASSTAIADALEQRQWRGYFFVTTGYAGRPGFLDGAAIRSLRRNGHIVGSHSHSHPLRMAACSEVRLRDEWANSVARLSDILGEAITIASVPGGHYADRVAVAAGEAGVRTLFTSTPTARAHEVGGVRVVGRYAIYRSTAPRVAAAIAAGDALPRATRAAWWTLKSTAKTLGPARYLKIRARLLGARDGMQWGDDVATPSEDPS